MNSEAFGRVALVVVCLISVGCQRKAIDQDTPPFRIIATDAGFVAPESVAAGMRHVIFENRGAEIHEAMLVKLPKGMSAKAYVAAVKAGSLFPEGALDYSGPGLTSPGETTELWLKVDPGNYVIICWNGNHDTTTPVHSFQVQDVGAADDRPPKEDVVLKLVDFRFDLTGELRKGVQVIRIETVGPAMHEADLYRLREGRTVADLIQWRKHGDQASALAAPAVALGGALDSHDLSRIVWLRKNFVPGRYVLHCEMPLTTAAAGSKMTHSDMGMVKEFEIKE